MERRISSARSVAGAAKSAGVCELLMGSASWRSAKNWGNPVLRGPFANLRLVFAATRSGGAGDAHDLHRGRRAPGRLAIVALVAGALAVLGTSCGSDTDSTS